MKNKISLCALLFLTIFTLKGQSDWERAKKAFEQENYLDAMSLCKADADKFPNAKRKLLRENLTEYSKQCFALFNKKDCVSLEKIKQIRSKSEFNITTSPQTDKKLEICKRTIPQTTSYVVDYKSLNKIVMDATTRKNILTNTNTILTEFDRAYSYGDNISITTVNVTSSAITKLQNLWKRSSFYITEENIGRSVIQTKAGWEIRDIPVFFEKGGNSVIAIEYTNDGIISDITEVLPEHLFYPEQITEKGSAPLDDILQFNTIKDFLELFRSSYCDKDIEFIETVFSDYALIIVGKELKINNKIKYSYTKKDKKTYISDLKKVFAKNEYVNVLFDDIKIMRDKGDSNVYGVTVRQRWFSSSYSDEGWLFLKIDFNNKYEKGAEIWVRTWQPLSVPDEEIFWLGSFNSIR